MRWADITDSDEEQLVGQGGKAAVAISLDGAITPDRPLCREGFGAIITPIAGGAISGAILLDGAITHTVGGVISLDGAVAPGGGATFISLEGSGAILPPVFRTSRLIVKNLDDMRVFVVMFNKQTDTIGWLRVRIFDKTGVAPQRQKLILSKYPLHGDWKVLGGCNLADESVLHLQDTNVINISISPNLVPTFALSVPLSLHVGVLKERVGFLTGMRPDSQRLTYGHWAMVSTKQLHHYNVVDGATIKVFPRLRAGGNGLRGSRHPLQSSGNKRL